MKIDSAPRIGGLDYGLLVRCCALAALAGADDAAVPRDAAAVVCDNVGGGGGQDRGWGWQNPKEAAAGRDTLLKNGRWKLY